jgi:hypothetical protein
MKNHILFLFFFLSITYSFSQKKNNVECGTFPFNESKKILLISYPNEESFMILDEDGNYKASKNDSLGFSKAGFKIEKEFLFQLNDTLPKKVYDATKIVELNQFEIVEFSNWIINYDYKIIKKNKPINSSLTKCYTPRNAFIFLNISNQVISVLEVCFECGHYYLLPNPNNFGRTLGIDCDEKFKYFKTLFENKEFSFQAK